MKKLLIGSLSIALLLSACGSKEDVKKEDKSTETKKVEKKEAKKEKTKTEKTKNKTKNTKGENKVIQDNSSNTNNAKQPEQINNQPQTIDVNNIMSRSDLEKVIYGNYSEVDKVVAYNNAVSKGIIPQGNVMEGPAAKAYESSLRVESGQEKSVYDNVPASHSDNWSSDQADWNNASEAEKEQIRRQEAENNGVEYNPDEFNPDAN